MRLMTRRAVFGSALVAVAGAALAQPGPGMMHGRGGPGRMGGGPMGSGPGRGPGMMADPAGYLDALKAQLAITAAQEPAWGAYADVVKTSAAQMQDVRNSMWQAMDTATWQERRDMMNRAFEAHQQNFTAVHEAAAKLEPSLTPNQRAKAAAILPGLRTPMGRRGMQGGPPVR